MQLEIKGLASGMSCAFIALLAVALGAGCGSGDDDDDDDRRGTGGSAGKSGAGGSGNVASAELCGTQKCPAGQYCVNGVACTPGCTSKDDCGSNQVCGSIDDTTHIGTCEDVATKDCAGYLTKCQACGGGDLCTQDVCDAYSLECVNCIAASNCNDSAECPCD